MATGNTLWTGELLPTIEEGYQLADRRDDYFGFSPLNSVRHT